MKTASILDRYLNEYAEQSICSVARTRSCVASLTAHLGKYDHTRLTPGLLRGYRQKEGLAPASINREFAVLRAALKWAQERGVLKSAPRIAKRGGENKRIAWLRQEEVERLLLAAQPYPQLLSFILLALLTGQRKEALLSLRWSQVDRGQEVIWFGDHGLPLENRRKGRGAVPISSGLRELLESLKNPSPWVLVNGRGSRYRDINWDQWRAACTQAGAGGLRPHDLRHTVATNLIREKVPLIDVSKLLGHSSTAVTEKIYVNHQPQFLSGVVQRLEKLAGVA